MLTLSVKKRPPALPTGQAGGKAGGRARAPALRRAGFIPAVVYGAHHASTPITVAASAFEKVLREAGEATIVSLSGLGPPGQGEPLPTLIHDVDLDPLTNRPRHVDFYAVTKGEKVEVAIPLAFVGISPAAEAGANLIKVLHEVEVEADPMNLPHTIEVDLSVLKAINDRIHVRDIVLPAGVGLKSEPNEVIALVQEVVEEKEEAPVAADIASIEVEKKGKEEEAAGGAAAPEEKSAKG
ncbi:50S ribosomal protein L25 [Candidatus Kaiserbacteria bacterium]|nr:50S ribosomal protein L25 [Candidatus Kaiserbacteria bacterium]